MADFFEIDPITGIKTETSWNDMTGEMTLIRSADVEPLLDYAKTHSNEVGMNREGMKLGWWAYATIPPIVQLQLLAKGINIYNEDDHEKMLSEINTHYPYLKLTTGKMGGKSKIVV